MPASPPATSPRRSELLELTYEYVLEHGAADLSLRPLAAAVGSSPRVLLFLFGSKAELVKAILARAREDELALLERVRATGTGNGPLAVASELWRWLAAEEHRGLLTLWLEGYVRSLIDPGGPWAGFGATTVADWLDVLAESGAAGEAEPTIVLAVLRGAMLDLLATGDVDRTTSAVNREFALLGASR